MSLLKVELDSQKVNNCITEAPGGGYRFIVKSDKINPPQCAATDSISAVLANTLNFKVRFPDSIAKSKLKQLFHRCPWVLGNPAAAI